MSSSLLKKSLQIVEGSQNEETQKKNSKDKFRDKNLQQGKGLKRLSDNKIEKNRDEMKKSKREKAKNSGIDKSTAEILFNYALGESRSITQQNKKKKKEESIFTDEDFNKFEKEYFS